MLPAWSPPISSTFSMVTPSVQEKDTKQCEGVAATSVDQSRGDIAPSVDLDRSDVNSWSSRSTNREIDSKRSADSPSARSILVCELHLPSDHGSSDSEDDSSVEEYGVVCSVHSCSTSVEQVRTDVPAADTMLPAYCLTHSCTHDPPLLTLPLFGSTGCGASVCF